MGEQDAFDCVSRNQTQDGTYRTRLSWRQTAPAAPNMTNCWLNRDLSNLVFGAHEKLTSCKNTELGSIDSFSTKLSEDLREI